MKLRVAFRNFAKAYKNLKRYLVYSEFSFIYFMSLLELK